MSSCTLRLLAIVVASAQGKFDPFGFKSLLSGKCLDLPGGGDNTNNGIPLWMWECLGEDSQQWYASEDKRIVFGGQVKGFKCIELLDGNVTNGQPVQFWDCRVGDSQAWGFDSEKGIIYFGTSAHEATKCLRASGQSNGDEVTIWDCIDGDPNQVWTFGPVVPAAQPTPMPPTAGPTAEPTTPPPSPTPLPRPGTGSCEDQCEAIGHLRMPVANTSCAQHPSCEMGCQVWRELKSAQDCEDKCRENDDTCDEWHIVVGGTNFNNCAGCPCRADQREVCNGDQGDDAYRPQLQDCLDGCNFGFISSQVAEPAKATTLAAIMI